MTAERRMPGPGFRADIQGLRAVAVGGVVLVHAGLPGLDGGFAGVDVFFVISGFLITGQLLELLRAGRLDLAGFYARRLRRLLPAALAVIAATAVASTFLLPRVLLPQSLGDAASAAVYVPNVVLAQRGTDYLADATPSLYQHFWSLGVEEQFYLVWPLLLLALAWVARRTRRPGVLPAALIAIAALSLAACIYETWASEPWAFFPMWTRAWQFAVGGLVAVASGALTSRMPETVRAALGWLGLAGIGAAFTVFDAATDYPGTAALLPTLAAAALIAAGDARRGPGLLLHLPPMQWLGRVSYSLYLVHWPLLQLAQARVGYDRPLPLRVTLGLAAVAVPVAWALHRFVEMPLRLHSRQPRPHRGWWRPMAAGLATSAVVASIAIGGSAVAASVPLTSGRDVANSALTAPPTATAFVPRSIHPALTAAAADNPPMYADGCELGFSEATPRPCTFGVDAGPRVVLFGDSHAAEWQPALAAVARDQGFQLVVETKSSCRSILDQQPGSLARDQACASWRDSVLADLAANPPAAVILANFDGAHTGDAATAPTTWQTGLQHTVAALPKASRLIVLADTPDLGKNPTQCLSQHLDDTSRCVVPAARALHSVGRSAVEASVGSTGASYVDLSPYLCDDLCSPIIGDTLVYRDDNHLTATFAAELAAPLGAALRPLLAPALAVAG